LKRLEKCCWPILNLQRSTSITTTLGAKVENFFYLEYRTNKLLPSRFRRQEWTKRLTKHYSELAVTKAKRRARRNPQKRS